MKIWFSALIALIFSPAILVAQEARPLRVLTTDSVPFIYPDEETGAYTGYEHAILESFADAVGRPLEVISSGRKLAPLLDKVQAGEADFVAAALTITEERLQRLDFTDGHLPVLIVLVERRGAESDDLSELRDKTVATLPGSSYEARFDEIGVAAKIYRSSNEDMFRDVASGEVDAMAIDSSFYLHWADEFPEVALTLPLSERQMYGFATRKGHPLIDAFNAHLKELKQSGMLQKFIRETFGDWAEAAIEDMDAEFFEP